ncbi:hypothetical protein CRG98_037929 [Punica granatum]|uniref:Uncharacterized protein n=1 Tax=Punica granatum TaxID=22663 RepID=A0A2I0IE74_PUNGR|nr:hypothetical protein CRG98_037929 [Punica granatum]
MASTEQEQEHEHREEEDAAAADDEDISARVAPIVKLEEVSITPAKKTKTHPRSLNFLPHSIANPKTLGSGNAPRSRLKASHPRSSDYQSGR